MVDVWNPTPRVEDGVQYFPEISPHVVHFNRVHAISQGVFLVDDEGLPTAPNRKNTSWAEFALNLIEKSKKLQGANGSKVCPGQSRTDRTCVQNECCFNMFHKFIRLSVVSHMLNPIFGVFAVTHQLLQR